MDYALVLNGSKNKSLIIKVQPEVTPRVFMDFSTFLRITVLTLLWCFIVVLAFVTCLFILKNRNKDKTHSTHHEDEALESCTAQNEISIKTRRKERHKSYAEKVNSVYYEWFSDRLPERNNHRGNHLDDYSQKQMNQQL